MGDIKVAVGILSFNRPGFLIRTLRSLRENAGYPFDEVLVDGGSDTETLQVVQQFGGELMQIETVGESMNIIIEQAIALHSPDYVIFSADDYEYKPDWLWKFVDFMTLADDDMKLFSLNWEPKYSWNTVRRVINQFAISRASLPGSSWAFRAEDWPLIGPVDKRTGGEDLQICQRLTGQGYELVALDLSEHIGEQYSAWGNRSYMVAQPLELDLDDA